MLLQCLYPDQAAQVWPEIREYVARAVAPVGDPDRVDLLLKAAVDGRLQIICATDQRGLVAVITAFVNTDLITEKKTYIVYTLATLLQPTREEWLMGLESLRKIAKQSGCSEIYAYTKLRSLLNFESVSDTGYTIIKL